MTSILVGRKGTPKQNKNDAALETTFKCTENTSLQQEKTYPKTSSIHALTTLTTSTSLTSTPFPYFRTVSQGGMVHQPNGPSSKALGKRPMRNGLAAPSPLASLPRSIDSSAPEEGDDDSLTASTVNVHARHHHKRVLPSRVRRGGVGSQIGTNDIDLNILDMLKRKGMYP